MNPDDIIRLHSGVVCHRVGDRGVQVTSLTGRSVTLEDHADAVTAVIDLYSQPSSAEQAAQALGGRGFTSAEIHGVTDFLLKRGFLVPDRGAAWGDPLLELIEAMIPIQSVSAEPLHDRITSLRITVVGEGILASVAREALAGAGIALGEDGLEAVLAKPNEQDFIFACSDCDDFVDLRRINDQAVAAELRAYYARISGKNLILGPYVVPRKLPCFACYVDRLESNITFIQEYRAAVAQPRSRFPATVAGGDTLLHAALKYNIVLDLVWHLFGRVNQSRLSEVRTVDLATGEIDKAPLLRAPRCDCCGSARDSDVKWAVRDLL